MSTLFAASEISINISNIRARTYLHTYIHRTRRIRIMWQLNAKVSSRLKDYKAIDVATGATVILLGVSYMIRQLRYLKFIVRDYRYCLI